MSNFQTPYTLTQRAGSINPSYTQSWRDFTSARATSTQYHDVFANDPYLKPTPWVAEHKQQFQAPQKYSHRVANRTLVHTGGLTDMAHVTHHTVQGTSLGGTMYRGLQHDAAFEESVYVARELQDCMPAIIEQCSKYHVHSQDGWISTAGFLACARKAGAPLTRTQFLALERSVPKEPTGSGRINVYDIARAVERLVGAQPPEQPPTLLSTAVIRYNTIVP